MANPAAEMKATTKAAAELLAYVQRLEAAIASSNNAATRNNLQTVLQERLNQYAQLVAKVKELEQATNAANRAALKAAATRDATTAGKVLGGTVAAAVGTARTANAAGGTGAIAGAANVATALVDAFKQLANISGKLASDLAPFAQAVQAFDPGLAQRFAMSLEDLSAASGRIFTPVIEVATQFADTLNGLLTSLAPAVTPVVDLLAKTLRDYAETYVAAVLPAVKALLPVFASLLDAVKPLIPIYGETAAQLASLFGEAVTTLKPLLEAVLPKLVEGVRSFQAVVQDVVAHVRAALATLGHVIQEFSLNNLRQAANGEGPLSLERLQEVFSTALERARQPALQQLDRNAPRTSAARAARLTSIEAIGQNARTAALGARDPAEQAVSLLDRIWQQIREWQRQQQGRDPAEAAQDANNFNT